MRIMMYCTQLIACITTLLVILEGGAMKDSVVAITMMLFAFVISFRMFR